MTSAVATALLVPAPAAAFTRLDPARVYLEARAAAIGGDHSRAADLFAQLVDTSAANPTVTKEAISQAISAGDMKLALRLAKSMPAASTPIEGRLLLVADGLRSNDFTRAVNFLQGGSEATDLRFLNPFIEAWAAADQGDQARALAAIDRLAAPNLLLALGPEHRALILLKFRRTAEAGPYVAQALKIAGGRDMRLRLAFAEGYVKAGDQAHALALLDDLGTETNRARNRLLQGKVDAIRIDDSRTAFSELALVLAAELNRLRNPTLPVAFAQVARFAAPDNSAAAIMLGALLDRRDRTNEALAVLRKVPNNDPLASQARDAEVRALVSSDRDQEALQAAEKAVASGMTEVGDYARLGDALSALKRYDDSAAAYQRALHLSDQIKPEDRWPLLLLQASALEQGNRWPQARAALTQAMALAPNEPLILNFLGYAQLERGENMDAAEAMIRKASALAPDDASITDSLGWAVYKRGRTKEAIEILTRAAKGDPTQAEIHEHLGDALYKAGNRFEARYAWSAALITGDDEISNRVKAKLETGLTPASAAP